MKYFSKWQKRVGKEKSSQFLFVSGLKCERNMKSVNYMAKKGYVLMSYFFSAKDMISGPVTQRFLTVRSKHISQLLMLSLILQMSWLWSF